MSPPSPRVSVLLTVYNGEPYVRDAVQSILDQTYQNFEFLIINDGSTDKTDEIIEEFDDPRLEVIHQENRGRSQSLNRGIRQSSCEFLAIIDDDDIAAPERLDKQIQYLENNTNVAAVGTQYALQNYNRKPDSLDSELISPPTEHDEIRKIFPLKNPFAHSSMMYRKSALESINGFNDNLSLCVDFDVYVKLVNSGYQLGSVDEVLCTVRRNSKYRSSFNINGVISKIEYLRTAFSIRFRASRNKELPLTYSLLPFIALIVKMMPRHFRIPIIKFTKYVRSTI